MTGEQAELVTMIRDSAAAVVPPGGDLSRIRGLRFRSPGFDPAVLREMAALGWIGLRLPEARGGAGLGMTESVALYEELGRGLVPEPLIALTLSAMLLAATGEEALLARLLSGAALVATAGAHRLDRATPARHDVVEVADLAEAFLMPDGPDLWLVPRDAVVLKPIALQDGGRMATIAAPPGAGRRIAADATAAFAHAQDEAALGTAAYLLGVAEAAFALTLAYLGQRRQFDRPLAAFQVLQHRMADLKIQLVLARASVTAAAAELDGGADEHARARATSRAKARASDVALLVGREAIQLHGAIGYTDEYDAGLYLRRAMVLAGQYGSAHDHRRRFAALEGG